ncbi:unnamed protein product [Adineta steineri]|uniref:Uncharacterized protein n=1 Tax=Adineta steineri TaxID=433720 RepID=A0A818T450_9BILA|nr:unnamed protein product [Adineta steineri]CAF0893386.1 unnamed protein product [Adineta steineri]CAF3590095.1 unnamed protein product [Adineta steineri]CAF3674627.1 unnamed protein product [Adineta steineri]
MNTSISNSMGDEKFQMHVDHDVDDNNRLIKSRYFEQRRPFRLTSLIYPISLALLILISTVLLVLTVTRRNTCRQQQLEQAEVLLGYKPDSHMKTWLPCTKTSTSSCACPATFMHSSVNPSHCIPNHSRCLQSCKNNVHCQCYNLSDGYRCRVATRNWVDNEFKGGAVERFRNPVIHPLLQRMWTDKFNRQLERILVDVRGGEHLFLSPNRQTGIAIHEEDDDYLINERWTKVDINTTQQHIVYTQLEPKTHKCRMSSIHEDGSVTHGQVHTCPGAPSGAPYFLGTACQNILVLWHGNRQLKLRRQEGWAMTRHHFESTLPRLPVLLDPFHRYYSVYDDSMIEIKDLNGEVLVQFFTDIIHPTRFEFVDQYGTLWIANQTHMQYFRSKNDQAWLDF